jgi:glucose/mannose-6-phosphate isomerase
MGSSGAIGDIFTAILSKTNIHVEVIKGYVLPKNS